ncbi:hypothetical protein GO730_37960 [Spirosoma sp. HMF3257]|uniref:hypothetical protein n=1 Tax=Spirosoma telluris TaxID=2183553 RepID=UPI0012FBCB3C|nr:hypothetical protein [Spirosoma telluris]
MNPSFREDDASQIPALMLLQAMGFTYLPLTKHYDCAGAAPAPYCSNRYFENNCGC